MDLESVNPIARTNMLKPKAQLTAHSAQVARHTTQLSPAIRQAMRIATSSGLTKTARLAQRVYWQVISPGYQIYLPF